MSRSESRLMRVLERKRAGSDYADGEIEKARPEAKTIEGLVDALKSEAAQIEIQGCALTDEELARLQTI